MSEERTENKKTKFKIILWGGINLFLICGIIFIVFFYYYNKKSEIKNLTTKVETNKEVPEKLFDSKKVKEEVKISVDIIEDGLRDIGRLVTNEYYFTAVETYSKKTSTKFFISSKSEFVYSYDGVVTSGIDCKDVKIKKDDTNKIITVELPKARILSTTIDYDSFKIYEEKKGWFSTLTFSDYNSAMREFVRKAEQSAYEKGIIKKATENASVIIKGFIEPLINGSEYTIKIAYR